MAAGPFGYRRALLATLLALAWLSGEAGPRSAGSALPAVASSWRPNIVFVLADDLDASLAERRFMPRTNRLVADEGARFENFIVDVSLCCPSRASILRGQYPHNTGIASNVYPGGGFQRFFELGLEESTVATWLQDAGYRTGFMGKYLNQYPGAMGTGYVPPGWDTWVSPAEGDPYQQFEYEMNEDGTLVHYGHAARDYLTDVLARKSRSFVEASAVDDRPFFLYVAPFAPHVPAVPAPRHALAYPDLAAPRTPSFNERDMSDKPPWFADLPPMSERAIEVLDGHYRQRARAVLAIDEMVASIVRKLEAAGQLENTYVFLTSDNGYHGGQHRLPSGKYTAYEEDIRVPMFVRGPGIQPGRSLQQLGSNIDFASTIAELAGAASPEFVDGRSLLPILQPSPVIDDSWRTAVLYEQGQGSTGVDPESESTGLGIAEPPETADAARRVARRPGLRALRTDRFMYIEYTTGDRELYNLRRDPFQRKNIAAAVPPVVIAALSAQLAELSACAGANCRERDSR